MTKKEYKMPPNINRPVMRQIIALLEEFFGEKYEPLLSNQVSDWLYTANPQLGGAVPRDFIYADMDGKRACKLLDFVKTMTEENKRSD